MSGSRGATGTGLRVSLIVGTAGVMLAWSWGTWPDVFVDFGRELYVAWRLEVGDVLYRDIAWFNGPLSAHWNALLFRLFGTGLRTLVLGNLAVVAATLLLLYSLLSRVGDRLCATVACVVFSTLFAFSQVDEIGNDNYLTPYSHEVTHGLALSLFAIWLFALRRGRPLVAALGSGLALGLVFLTKSEVFLAAAGALGAGWLLDWRQASPEPERGQQLRLVAFVGGTLAPPVVSFALLSSAMPTPQALLGTLGS